MTDKQAGTSQLDAEALNTVSVVTITSAERNDIEAPTSESEEASLRGNMHAIAEIAGHSPKSTD